MELLPLVCLCLLSCSGDGVKVMQDGDAVLPCSLSTEDISGKVFGWRKDGQEEAFMYNNGLTGQDEQFKGRVSHFQDQLQNDDASVEIEDTKMDDSEIFSCDFQRLQSKQTFEIEFTIGAAPEPVIKLSAVTKDGVLLQCEAHGDPRPAVEWKDGDNNTLPAEEPQTSERDGRYYVSVKITVTKTDDYRCVATQEKFSHQVAAVIPVHVQGSNTGLVDSFLVVCAVLGAVAVPAWLYTLSEKKDKTKSDGVELNPTDQNPTTTTEPLIQPDP